MRYCLAAMHYTPHTPNQNREQVRVQIAAEHSGFYRFFDSRTAEPFRIPPKNGLVQLIASF